jgi:predicted membrane protein DUF2232
VIRTSLLIGVLALCAILTSAPWGALWLAVPAVVAVALLLCWRWGPWGVAVPVGLLAGVMVLVGPYAAWSWWIPVAALTGCWMGLREEGGGPDAGQRAWMLLPLLLLAAGLPWALSYPDLVTGIERALQLGDSELIKTSQDLGYHGDRLQAIQHSVRDAALLRARVLPNVLPSVLFVWMAVLVVAGRDVSARVAGRLRWPELSQARLIGWRLPDGAIWVFLAGLALLLADYKSGTPTAWTLLIVSCLGYCVQGIAVVESLLLLRGVPPSIITLTLLFVLVMAFPVFVLTTVCVGLSDVWLDYRRTEVLPDGDPS